ncbi:MAG: aminoacyl-tRNA hydrolase [Gemmatimonadota bacterium]
MKTIFSIGNPGDRYRDTRHNAGWWLADHLATRWRFGPYRLAGDAISVAGQVDDTPARIVRPLTFVNRSGRVLTAFAGESDFDAASDLLVLVDDVALEPGRFRLRARGSSGGHRGLESIEEALSSSTYGRVRIGVGRPQDDRIQMSEYVTAAPLPFEEETILEAFEVMAEAIECWLREGIEPAMNRFNNSH